MTDAELAAHIAGMAGRLLVDLRSNYAGQELGREGDRLANEAILEALAGARPADAVLSEERVCDGGRLSASRVWIVDPLDGTREYAEGRDDWAVHIALAIDGSAAIGAVALPARGEVFSSAARRTLQMPHGTPRMLVSRTRPSADAVRVADALGAEMIPMGSAGAKAMAIVRGHAEIYLHSGGQYEWDNCAPVAVAAAHGLHCSRIDGSALRYNQPDVYLPDLLICRPELAPAVLEAVRI